MSRMTRSAALVAAAALVAGAVAPVAAQDTSGAPLEGTLTLWHSYGSGAGTEADALAAALANVTTANPGLTVNVLPVDFGAIYNNWSLDIGSGATTPDLMIVPNDSLGQQTRDQLLAPLDALVPADVLAGEVPLAVEGSKVDGVLMQVPESLKAVAMYYDSAKVPTPPATTDELLQAVTDGTIKLGLVQGAYHDFGFAGAFGGTLMDETGKCIADQGGFAEAFQFLADLKAAGATFDPTYDNIAAGFKDGTFDVIIDGPWAAGGYVTSVPTVGVAAMPAGPAGPALPFTGVDGWLINPNSPNQQLAVDLAIALTSAENQKIFADTAYHIPANASVTIDNPISSQFAEAVASGYPRPQSAQFGAFWGPFGDALNKVLDTGADPVQAVADACAAMNTANGL
jgi:arabinogalactan oligomer / maltooligosaccharide transport system substrate-binding protein